MVGAVVQQRHGNKAFQGINPCGCENGGAIRGHAVMKSLCKICPIPRTEYTTMAGWGNPWIGKGNFSTSSLLIELCTQAWDTKVECEPIDPRLRIKVIGETAE